MADINVGKKLGKITVPKVLRKNSTITIETQTVSRQTSLVVYQEGKFLKCGVR